MVGQLALDQHIGVRLPASQPAGTARGAHSPSRLPLAGLVRKFILTVALLI